MCGRCGDSVVQPMAHFPTFDSGSFRGGISNRVCGSCHLGAVLHWRTWITGYLGSDLCASSSWSRATRWIVNQEVVEVVIGLIEPAFLCGKITESCPAESGLVAFAPDYPGALPRGGDVYALLEIPSVFTSGVILHLEAGDAGLRLAVNGDSTDLIYHSAGEDVVGSGELVANIFGTGSSKRRPRTRGAKAPGLIGFKAPTAKLLDVLSAGGAPAKGKPRRPSIATAAGASSVGAVPKDSSSMQAEVLAAISAVGDRLSRLERLEEQHQSTRLTGPGAKASTPRPPVSAQPVSYTHLRAHETEADL
eukprot:2597540-Amphidinium_carterae.2